MPKQFGAVFAVGIVIGVCSFLQAQPRGRGGASGWFSSLAEGKAEGRKTGKPLMVVVRCEP